MAEFNHCHVQLVLWLKRCAGDGILPVVGEEWFLSGKIRRNHMKFYKCATCGKIVAVVKDTDVEAVFALIPYEKVKGVYEYCNLHGLWKKV